MPQQLQEIDEQTLKPVKEESPAPAYTVDEMARYIKDQIKGPKGSRAIVKHLWGMFFRINFYVNDKIEGDCLFPSCHIAESKFVSLGLHDDGLIIRSSE